MNPRALSVFVVEDSDLMVGLLQRILRTEVDARLVGHSADADAAIAEILAERPHVVVVDLSLRAGTGYDVLRVVGKLDPPPTCLVLTNHSTAPYQEAAWRLGVKEDHFFDKVEQVPAMIACLRRLAERRSPCDQRHGGSSPERDDDGGDRRRSV